MSLGRPVKTLLLLGALGVGGYLLAVGRPPWKQELPVHVRGEGAVAGLAEKVLRACPFWAILRDHRDLLPESCRELEIEVTSERRTHELHERPGVTVTPGQYDPGSVTVTLRVKESATGVARYEATRERDLAGAIRYTSGGDPQTVAFQFAEEAALEFLVPAAACRLLKESPELAAKARTPLVELCSRPGGSHEIPACLAELGPAAREAVPAIAASPAIVTPELVRALGTVGGPEALKLVRANLKSSDRTLAGAAAETLPAFGTDAAQAVPDLLARLKGEDGTAIVDPIALVALARVAPDHPGLTGTLVGLLGADYDDRPVLDAFRELGPRASAAVPDLLDKLDQGSASAALALGYVGRGNATVVSRLASALDGDRDELRNRATEALCAIGGAEVRTAMVELLENGPMDSRLPGRAATVIGGLGAEGDAAVPALERVWFDDRKCRVVGNDCAEALIRLGTESARRVLEAARSHANPRVRRSLAQAWGRELEEGARNVATLLAWFRTDPDAEVRYEAMRVLAQVAPEDREFHAELASRLTDDRGTAPISDVLRGLGAKANSAVPRLLELLDHADPLVRDRAIEALAAVDARGPEVLRALIARLSDTESYVRAEAAKALGEMGEAAAEAATALEALRNDPVTREAAEEALQRVRKTE